MLKSPSHIAVLFGLLMVGIIAGATKDNWCKPAQAICHTQPADTAETRLEELAPRYFVYSDAALQYAQESQKKVILYFWAPWCSSCASLDIEIEKDPELIPEGIVLLRIDYDRAPELRTQYGITIQHTFVQVDADGNAITTWVGGEPSDLSTKVK